MTVVFTIQKSFTIVPSKHTSYSWCYFLELISEDIGLKYDSQSKKFPDQSFPAIKMVNPVNGRDHKYGRLYLPDSSWCSFERPTSYLEIVLVETFYIFAVSMQGFFRKSSSISFTKKVRLHYSTDYQNWYNTTGNGDEWVSNNIMNNYKV